MAYYHNNNDRLNFAPVHDFLSAMHTGGNDRLDFAPVHEFRSAMHNDPELSPQQERELQRDRSTYTQLRAELRDADDLHAQLLAKIEHLKTEHAELLTSYHAHKAYGERYKVKREALHAALRASASNDWLLHDGNVYFARDRASLTAGDCTPLSLSATAYPAAGGGQPIAVLGIGTIFLDMKRQLSRPGSQVHRITALHILAARCNWIPTSRIRDARRVLGTRPDERFTVTRGEGDYGPIWCGNGTSGRLRFCLAGEADDFEEERHVTVGESISISADRGKLGKLVPQFGFGE